ncbi:MAG: VPLPA-CTERM sorting domain-containing protein [Pseudomonadota bacterium]
MRKVLLAAASAVALTSGGASALTLDFTDGVFGTSNPAAFGVAGFQTISETAGGVTFSLTATNNLVGTTRWLNSAGSLSNGLQLGGGGGSVVAFDLVVDTDVTLDSYALTDVFGFLGTPDFDILDGATLLSEDNALSPRGASGLSFDNGPIALTAGTTYSFDINNTGSAVQTFLASIDFSLTEPPRPTPGAVPLPAGLPLLLAGLGAFAWMRRRQAG